MSMTGTLEKGAHHQALDLSEELPPHHLHHHTNHHQHLHHSNSLASTTAMGGGRETPSRVVIPPPYSAAESGGGGSEAPLELRGSLDCWACSVLVTAQNLVIAAINACLAAVVFGTILVPAIVMVVFGFLCHSTVRPHGTTPYCSDLLTDGGCVALLVVGFLLVTPLLVLALAAYCRLARHLQLGLCFIPYSRAVYKNLPATQHRGIGTGCCGGRDGADSSGKGKVTDILLQRVRPSSPSPSQQHRHYRLFSCADKGSRLSCCSTAFKPSRILFFNLLLSDSLAYVTPIPNSTEENISTC